MHQSQQQASRDHSCQNPECDTDLRPIEVSERPRSYCSIACRSRASRLRVMARNAGLTSKICVKCKADKPMSAYQATWRTECRDCANAIKRERYRARGGKERVYAQNLANNYGLTPEQHEEMVSAQRGKCAICGQAPSHRLHVDHDHTTGAVRKLLCRPCNYALGNAKDDPTRLRAMADYLDQHRIEAAA